jgi:hypothetical protein
MHIHYHVAMPIVVYSPFSGQAVKVREADVGRAVRDPDGRVFYVLARSDGKGYYGAPTRAGGPKDEARAAELAAAAVRRAATDSETTVHDATGRGRPGGQRRLALLVLIVLLLAALAVWLFTVGPLGRHGAAMPPHSTTQPASAPAAVPAGR